MTTPQCDLHTHTHHSDGTLTPAELVRAAKAAGLSALAVTDHDTLNGLAEARLEGEKAGLQVVPGVELSCSPMSGPGAGGELHLLGYFVDADNAELQKTLARLRAERIQRADRILERLKTLGITLDAAELNKHAGGASVGRPHIARALVAAGRATSVQDAFDRYLREGRAAYVPRTLLTPEEAVRLVRLAGGAPVAAHPRIGGPRNRGEWDRLVSWGLAGIEVFHPDHPPQAVREYGRLARELGLVGTGGSDFHSPEGERAPIGTVTAPLEVVEEIRRRLKS